MRSTSLVNSPDRRPRVLIAALSGRSLAAAAANAGYAPLVADLFGDDDMRAHAPASVLIEGDLESGFDESTLVMALERVAAGRHCEGIVCGGGFEDRPAMLERLA